METRSISRLFTAFALAIALAGGARAEDVKIANDPKAGSYLADAKGMALYVFKKDSPDKSVCAGQCVAAWPLFYREKVAVSAGLDAGDFGTITREDGQKQTTYKHMPLYLFVKDTKPGETTGHGAKDVWFLAQP